MEYPILGADCAGAGAGCGDPYRLGQPHTRKLAWHAHVSGAHRLRTGDGRTSTAPLSVVAICEQRHRPDSGAAGTAGLVAAHSLSTVATRAAARRPGAGAVVQRLFPPPAGGCAVSRHLSVAIHCRRTEHCLAGSGHRRHALDSRWGVADKCAAAATPGSPSCRLTRPQVPKYLRRPSVSTPAPPAWSLWPWCAAVSWDLRAIRSAPPCLEAA